MSETKNRRGFGNRARMGLNSARREATAPRLATVGALALGAAAFGLLRNPERRERLTRNARDLSNRLMSGWGRQSANPTPNASGIAIG
jgi:hypothetical protein